MQSQRSVEQEQLYKAASLFRQQLSLPYDAAAVFAWSPQPNEAAILVSLLPDYRAAAALIPSSFSGFPVAVKVADMPTAS